MNETQLINNIDNLISEIKSCIRTAGINNDSSEFQIVTEIFLYKFLNDKFKFEVKKISKKLAEAEDFDVALEELPQNEFLAIIDDLNPDTAVIERDQTISYLYKHKEYRDDDGNDFAWLLDETLIKIANANIDIFSVSTESKDKIKLFEGVCKNIIDKEKRNGFAKAVIGKLIDAHNFEAVFNEKYDFFSTIFEHLISEYNSNGGGVNAEYYTPKSVAQIIARILIDGDVQNVEVCDPTAGSGTLLMAIAHEIGEDKCTIYSQDLTQKSVKLLRLNLILNNLTHSLPNVKQADILEYPQFNNDAKTDLREFDYIVSNPPFNVDFSMTHDACLKDSHVKANGHKRFFAGVPSIPKKDKKSMKIYLLVLQHIIYSLKENGKAGIVVPTKFLDLRDGIAVTIRQYLVDKKYLKAVVTMPPQIFANTGTSVSVLFIDKENLHDEIYLMDASSIGTKESIEINDKKVKRTVLNKEDEDYIVNNINSRTIISDISVEKDIETISKKNYSLCAGQYFDISLPITKISAAELKERTEQYDVDLRELFGKTETLRNNVINSLGGIKK